MAGELGKLYLVIIIVQHVIDLLHAGGVLHQQVIVAQRDPLVHYEAVRYIILDFLPLMPQIIGFSIQEDSLVQISQIWILTLISGF